MMTLGLRESIISTRAVGRKKIFQYQKFTYWLTETDFNFLKENLSARGIDLFVSKRAVCVPLSKEVEIGFVPSDAWGKYPFCRRPLSWYKASPFVGRILVVSSFDLKEYHFPPETIIRESDFQPSNLPDREGKIKLIEKESYQKAKSTEWEDIDAEGPELHNQWLRMMGLREVSYEELFITHCANHANFIEPTYFIVGENRPVPYSIDKTSHICSACLEFFNIIGTQFRKKMVVPCPGAVLFAGMAANRYYEVLRP
jgi:hypothetical protein